MTDRHFELPHEAAMGQRDADDTSGKEGEYSPPVAAGMSERLRSYREWMGRQWPDYTDIYARFVSHLVETGAGIGGPKVGDTFPDFILPSQRGRLVRMSQLLCDGCAIISFNRGHWCGFCHIELTSLNQAVPRFRERGASVVSIIPEPEVQARQLHETLRLDFDVLSDMDLGFATQLDLTVYLGEELRTFLLADDVNIGAYQRNEGWFLPIPATFVVDRDQRVLDRYVDPDFRNRMQIEAILAAIG